MKTFYKILFVIIAFHSWAILPAKAQGIIAGDIAYTNLSPLTYQFRITLYSEQSTPDSLLMTNWEDSISAVVYPFSTENTGMACSLNVKKSIFIFTHSYPGQGNYTLTLSFSNRIAGIVNIPNSGATSFTLRAAISIGIVPGNNHAPVFSAVPIETADVGTLFIHNPIPYDVEADSLSYMAMPALGAGGIPVPGYSSPLASNYFRVDSVNGDVTWDSPMLVGIYSVGYLTNEWRYGFFIGSVQREMIICVREANGISKLSGVANEINIYPNPTKNELMVRSKEFGNGVEINIYDVVGEKVYKSKIQSPKSVINISDLRSGVYFVEVRNGRDVFRKKFIKE